MKRIAIIGASSHGKVVIDAVEKAQCYAVVGLLDRDKEAGADAFGYPVLGKECEIESLRKRYRFDGVFVAIGDNWTRFEIVKRLREQHPELELVTVVHPSASIGRGVHLGAGSVVLAGSVICADARVGECCIVNTHASLDHDSVLGDFSSLAPGVNVGGAVEIGSLSAVCLGAKVIHGVRIGRSSVIGAGATVIKDVPEYVVAYGTPAVPVRPRLDTDRYL